MPHEINSPNNDVNAENASVSIDHQYRYDQAAVLSGAVSENQCKGFRTDQQKQRQSVNQPIKKRKRGCYSFTTRQKKNLDGIGVFVRRKLKYAFRQPDVFEHFSVERNLSSLLDNNTTVDTTPPTEVTFWDDSEPRVAVDQNGIPILVFIPHLFSEDDNTAVCAAMYEFHRNNESGIQPKSTGSNARNRASNFPQPDGDNQPMVGVIELGVIVEQGSSDREPRASAANFGTNTVTSVAEATSLHDAFEFCRTAENIGLSYIDPQWYGTLQAVRHGIHHSNPVNKLIQGIDPSYWPAHTVTWNRHIHPHFDVKDHPEGWSSLSVYGTFQNGGDLFVPALNLFVCFTPKSQIYIRGRMLKHGILPFQGGDRFAHTSYLPFSIFTHYKHLFCKLPHLVHSSNARKIRLSLENNHRVHRNLLKAMFGSTNKNSASCVSMVLFKTKKYKLVFRERARRAKARNGAK